MRVEIPQFKRCCCCVPLRYGLLVWSYFLLIPLALFLTAQILELRYVHVYIVYYGLTAVIRNMVFLLVLVGNLAFTFLLIVAAHKKSSKLLKISNKCALAAAIATFVTLLLDCIYDLTHYGIGFWFYLIIYVVMGLTLIGMQMYIIALVRSEVMKLESTIGYEFHNIAADAEKGYYEPEIVRVDDQNCGQETEANKQTEEIKTLKITDM